MTNGQLILLTAVTFSVIIAFVLGMFYINKRLREKKSIRLTVLIPIAASFIIGIIMLIIAYGSI